MATRALVVIPAVILLAAGGCRTTAGPGETPRENKPPMPWVHSFTPQRTLYVSPVGTGAGTTPEAPMGLKDAVAKSEPGDLYWLLEGEYKGGFDFTRHGQKDKPIVYRARSGKRATINGPVAVLGGYTWLWGIEFIDPEPLKSGKEYTAHIIRLCSLFTVSCRRPLISDMN